MSEAARTLMSVEDFLAWAERQPERPRYELIAGAPVAMAPETLLHTRLKYRVARALEEALRSAGLDCEAFTDGPTVPIDEQTAYEPAALVHCGARLEDGGTVVADPVIVVEVVSPGSRRVDTGAKLAGYFRLPSLAHYLIVDAQRKLVVHHRREPGGEIGTRIVAGGSVLLTPPGLTISIDDIFRIE